MGHKHQQLFNNICKYQHTHLYISFVVVTLFFELAPQPFMTVDIHCAGHFGIVHLRTCCSQWEKFVTATIPNTQPGWAFTPQVLSFVISFKGNYNYFMPFSLASEGSQEKKDMDLQLSLDMTKLSFCRTSQVVSGEIAP